MPTLSQVKERFQATVSQFEKGMADFKAKLDTNPNEALRWSDTIMSLTARMTVAKHFLASTAAWEKMKAEGTLSEAQPQTDEDAVKFIHEAIVREALRRNRFTNQSTSNGHNKMDREEAAYYAEIADEWAFLY